MEADAENVKLGSQTFSLLEIGSRIAQFQPFIYAALCHLLDKVKYIYIKHMKYYRGETVHKTHSATWQIWALHMFLQTKCDPDIFVIIIWHIVL